METFAWLWLEKVSDEAIQKQIKEIWKNVSGRAKLVRKYLKEKWDSGKEKRARMMKDLKEKWDSGKEKRMWMVKVLKQKIREKWRNATKVVAILVSVIALMLWLEQVTRGVRESVKSIPLHYLWWGLGIVAAVALLVWLFKDAERRRQAIGVYRSRWFLWPVVVLLVVAIGIGAYGYLPWSAGGVVSGLRSPDATSTAGTTFTVVARPRQPAEGVMPPGWRIDWWGDPDKFDSSQVVWRGGNKVQLFHVKPGVDEVELTLHIYPCATRTC